MWQQVSECPSFLVLNTIPSYICGWVARLLALFDNAAVNMSVPATVPKVEFLDSMITLCLALWEATRVLTTAVPEALVSPGCITL